MILEGSEIGRKNAWNERSEGKRKKRNEKTSTVKMIELNTKGLYRILIVLTIWHRLFSNS